MPELLKTLPIEEPQISRVNIKCGFWVHIRDSYPNEPDPLAAIALRDIAQSNLDLHELLRPFKKVIEQGAAHSRTLSGKDTELQADQYLRHEIRSSWGAHPA
ncbi:uncharacterized protein DSM5745_09462 [Aspergillus mulundensis]|uniref:Uncharacterized protein n=1 Tax=Aspergillus mulundensis TaxID=1810919 RepID=A0A3D8QV35_9EURO|nr:hypothetical protein DSM5745_09462 [Aspergillus mulundensis]RDW65723.1 hypothetical protein DSM5745_09462 [Aspergillus mulundensis]